MSDDLTLLAESLLDAVLARYRKRHRATYSHDDETYRPLEEHETYKPRKKRDIKPYMRMDPVLQRRITEAYDRDPSLTREQLAEQFNVTPGTIKLALEKSGRYHKRYKGTKK